MRKIRASSLQHGDTLVSCDPNEEDTFIVMDGDNPDHWDVLVIASDMMKIGGEVYNVGCIMRAWIYKLNTISGDYDIYRGGSLVSPSR